MPGKKKTLLGNPILPLPAESKGTLPDGFFKNLKGFEPLPGAASEKKKYGGMMKKKNKKKKKK